MLKTDRQVDYVIKRMTADSLGALRGRQNTAFYIHHMIYQYNIMVLPLEVQTNYAASYIDRQCVLS